MDHTGSVPVSAQWRWSKPNGASTQYWNGTAWDTNNSFRTVGSSPGTHGRWAFDANLLQIKPAGGVAPFASYVPSFFDSSQIDLTVEVKLSYGSGPDSIVRYTTHPLVPTGFNQNLSLLDASSDGNNYQASQISFGVSSLNNLAMRLWTNDTFNNSAAIKFEMDGAGTVGCGPLSTYFTVSFNSSGGYYALTPKTVLKNLLDDTGQFNMQIYPSDCASTPSPALALKVFVQGTQRVLVRLHYRDPLGSSSLSQAYRVSSDQTGNLPGIQLAVGSETLGLFAQTSEWSFYKPFGGRVGRSASMEDDSRYTDHEYDEALDLNYMKGRYQDAAQAKFNRPDPKRDWDWLRPHTLNLYEYTSNDPINAYDPDGYYTLKADKGVDLEAYAEEFEKRRLELLNSNDPKLVEAAAAYGMPGVENGVIVNFGVIKSGDPAEQGSEWGLISNHDENGKEFYSLDRISTISFDPSSGDFSKELSTRIAHEGSHLLDDIALQNSFDSETDTVLESLLLNIQQTEEKAYMYNHLVGVKEMRELNYVPSPGFGKKPPYPIGYGVYPDARVQKNIKEFVKRNYRDKLTKMKAETLLELINSGQISSRKE